VTAPEQSHGVAELARRFVLVEHSVVLGGETVLLLKPRSAEELIDEEDFALDERLPYWADLWPSAIALANRVIEENGADRRLLELGCGLGLVTAAAIRAGYDALATDYYEDALRFTIENSRRLTDASPEVRLVNWRTLPDDLGTFDRIVAADVLYERGYGELVADVVAALLAPGGRATIADPGRVAAGIFVDRCAELGLSVETSAELPVEDGPMRQRIRFYDLRWAANRQT
jgi:predicted nicotinamide N-methyase